MTDGIIGSKTNILLLSGQLETNGTIIEGNNKLKNNISKCMGNFFSKGKN